MRKRIALVNHRFGSEIASGSEMHCLLLAHRLSSICDVRVLTTCAIDDNTWANHYPEGKQEVEGIDVIRFPVVKERDWGPYERLDGYIKEGNAHVMEDEVQWVMAQGPYAPDLYDYLHTHYAEYDAIIFMTYLYYTSALCILGLPNAIFLPTAHDEKALRLPFYQFSFAAAKAYIFNTEEEKSLLESRFECIKDKPGFVGCFGIEFKEIDDKAVLPTYPYILYAGRINAAKSCDELVSFFVKYKDQHPSDLRLVLIGKKDMPLPERDDIEYRGFVDEEEKMQLMAGARFLSIASRFESLSIVALEALSVNTPILVSSKCPVLKGHTVRSRSGYAYGTFEEFANALEDAVSDNEAYRECCKYGRDYVKNNYSWDTVVANIVALVDKVGYTGSLVEEKALEPVYEATFCRRKLEPAFCECDAVVVMASDDNYAPLVGVALQSIIDSSKQEHNYDIIVLSDRISKVNKKQLLNMVLGKENISLRFCEVADRLDKWNFSFTNEQLSRGTFMRLLIPQLFSAYDKLIYLDCDTVVKKDIAELYAEDIEGYLFGGIRDVHINVVWQFRENVKKHLLENVKVSNPEDYFNAGVMLINVKELIAGYTSEKLLELAVSRRWMWEDQDVLNHISVGKVKFLSPQWDVFVLGSQELMHIMKQKLAYCYAIEHPYIIHYAGGTLPIKCLGEEYATDFWCAARKTPFYELLVNRMPAPAAQVGVASAGRNTRRAIWNKRHLLTTFIRDYGLLKTMRMVMVLPQALLFAPKGTRYDYIKKHVNAIRYS